MLRVVFQHAGRLQRGEEFVECDRIFDHLLVCMLCDSHALCRHVRSNMLYDRIYITCAGFVGHPVVTARQCAAAGAVRRM